MTRLPAFLAEMKGNDRLQPKKSTAYVGGVEVWSKQAKTYRLSRRSCTVDLEGESDLFASRLSRFSLSLVAADEVLTCSTRFRGPLSDLARLSGVATRAGVSAEGAEPLSVIEMAGRSSSRFAPVTAASPSAMMVRFIDSGCGRR